MIVIGVDERVRSTVAFSFVELVAKAFLRFDLSLSDLQRWSRLAMFSSLRGSGATIEQACDRLDVSKPTGWRLAKELRDDFLDPEAEHALPLRIVYALRTEARSLKKLQQIFPNEKASAIERALEQLQKEDRVRICKGRTPLFEATRTQDRLVGPTWSSRIGALKALLAHVLQTVDARIVQDRPEAFARTIDLKLGRRQQEKLTRFYEEQLWPFLSELEDEALAECKGDDSPDDFQISLLWSKREQNDHEPKE